MKGVCTELWLKHYVKMWGSGVHSWFSQTLFGCYPVRLNSRARISVMFPKSKTLVRMIPIMFEIFSGDMAHGKALWQRPIKEGWRQRMPHALIGQQYWTKRAVIDFVSKNKLFAEALWCQKEHYTACLQGHSPVVEKSKSLYLDLI